MFSLLCGHRASDVSQGIFALLIACLLSLPTVQAEDWELSANVSYEGRHVGWGDNEMEEGGLYSVAFEVEKDGFFVELWLADAEDVDFQETSLSLGYEWLLADDLGAELAFVRVDAFEDGGHEHEYEVEASLAYELANWVASLNYAYATGNDGDVLSFALEGEYEVGGFGIHPGFELVRDFGFIEQDTLSSVQLSLGVSRQLSDSLELEATLAHLIALNSLREEYHSLTWGGIAFTVHF